MNNSTDPARAAAAPLDSPVRYDSLTIALHWVTAALVLLLFALAETWDFFPKPIHHLMITGHMSLGLVLAAVIALRILWRLLSRSKAFASNQGILEQAAKALHYVLYVLITAEAVLGFFTRWTDNHGLSFFGLLIPSPFGTFSKATGGFVEEIHDLNAWLIIILVGGHTLAALGHHYLLKDDVLRRMLPRRGR
ncbi:cytochrome b [Acidocella aromatica]|uniref:Cytochrome b561 n=1 Tax=Acidocella aromatica TaxID=1303579 RepID=A0A840VCB7_9PROT|nr:cytochrome b [Acidocella aromatica]MBB5373443.1 cytochrome b561 [Acidocella aromatica]